MGRKGALAEPNTFEWIAEEIGAHELASQVLNEGTKGKYLDIISRIVNRSESNSIVSMLISVKLEDLKDIDGLFAKPSKEELNNRLPQYYLDLSFSWLRKRF
jgi:hypothetical protein